MENKQNSNLEVSRKDVIEFTSILEGIRYRLTLLIILVIILIATIYMVNI
ncbi:hypothetical protein H9L01_01555 [Erysipelothrix inopinata]|uniref:Uncharacterized protein n=1 Tax=Erysipelothrix inopinata TaxID=225084 RepID=A0A7G9RZQ3_9FIRM|nr:hypothetical protein [Erysipelothrix inopinata]QNN61078.1 hypothetical protein H9L01_01555 [Erysipelothrix inopinata]